MLTLLLLVTLTTPPQAPCLPQSMLPVVDDVPRVTPAPAPAPVVTVTTPEVVYRIGSLPPTWVPPSPPVYYQPAPVYAPAICLPGRR